MVKKRTAKESKTIDFESDNEDFYDEIDKFHQEDRKIKSGLVRNQKSEVKEVLNVEADLSDDEVRKKDDGHVSSDFDDDDDDEEIDPEAELPSRDKWGRNQKNFYKTTYVDKDYGGVGDDEDEELAALEEEDARVRQRALDAAAADIDILDDLEDEDDNDAQIVQEVEDEWKSAGVRKTNKETVNILKDYRLKKEMFTVIVEPLLNVAKALPDESPLKTKLTMCSNLYGSYLSTVLYWLSLKAKSLSEKVANNVFVDEHPALTHIWKLKEMTDSVDAFVGRNSDLLSKLIKRSQKGLDVDVEAHEPILTKKQLEKKASLAKPWETSVQDGEGEEVQADTNGETEEGGDDRRQINYTIEKNKDLKYRKKRGPTFSRTRKRVQYKSALNKHKSQRPTVRSEMEKYGGEARGIRASTVKSVKLHA